MLRRCVFAAIRKISRSQAASPKSTQKSMPKANLAIHATSLTALDSIWEPRSDSKPPPDSASFACCGRRVGLCPCWNTGGSTQLPNDRPLVGHAPGHHQVHRVRKLRARLFDGKQCPRWILPHMGGALPRGGLAYRKSGGGFSGRRKRRISSKRSKRREELFRPEALQSLRGFSMHTGVPRGCHVPYA